MLTKEEQIERLIEAGKALYASTHAKTLHDARKEWDAIVAEIKGPWRDSGRKDNAGWPIIEDALSGRSLCAVSPWFLDWLLDLLRKHAPEGMPKEDR